MRKIESALHERIKKLISSMGCEFIGGEILSADGKQIFRLYVDAPNGVTIDQCADISRQVGAMMDVDDSISGRYALEVSSPGIDRPFFELSQCVPYVGSQLKLRLLTPVAGRRKLKGKLLSVEEEKEELCLMVETIGEITIDFSKVDKANLIGEVTFK